MATEPYLKHEISTEWSEFLQAKFLPSPVSSFQCSLENHASIIACFPFCFLSFSFQSLQVSSEPNPVKNASHAR